MRPTLLRTTDALLDLRAEWETLFARVGGSPFQSPAWLLPWWTVWGTGEPRVAIARADDGKLLGVLPLYLLPDEGKLLPIGSGVSDYFDVLLDPAAPPRTAELLLREAVSHDDVPCHLIELRPDSPLADGAHPASPCPVLRLREGLRATVPSRQHRKLRMSRNRAAEIGGFTIETATEASAAEMFAALAVLHGARWRERGESGVLEDAAVRAFHGAAVPQLQKAGALRLQRLTMVGRIAAAVYALVDTREHIYFYLSGFAQDFARESPGTLLLGAMLDEAIAEGRREAHFLRGDEAYKYAWGAERRFNMTRVIPARSWPASATAPRDRHPPTATTPRRPQA